MATEDKWVEKAYRNLVGKRIAHVEYMDNKEAENNGWGKRPLCLRLNNGHWLVPMADDEGNDGGALSTTIQGYSTIPVLWTENHPVDVALDSLGEK